MPDLRKRRSADASAMDVLVARMTRPHMKRRKGETVDEWQDRLLHSCYRCGHYEDDLQALRAHEDSHSATDQAEDEHDAHD